MHPAAPPSVAAHAATLSCIFEKRPSSPDVSSRPQRMSPAAATESSSSITTSDIVTPRLVCTHNVLLFNYFPHEHDNGMYVRTRDVGPFTGERLRSPSEYAIQISKATAVAETEPNAVESRLAPRGTVSAVGQAILVQSESDFGLRIRNTVCARLFSSGVRQHINAHLLSLSKCLPFRISLRHLRDAQNLEYAT